MTYAPQKSEKELIMRVARSCFVLLFALLSVPVVTPQDAIGIGALSPVEDLARTQMQFLTDLQKSKKLKTPLKISLLKENTEHGKDFEKGVLDYVKAHPRDFSVVLNESFELYAPDYRPLLSRVENAKGDIFMC